MGPWSFDEAALRFRFEVWGRLRAGKHPSFDLSHSQFGEDMIVRSLLAPIKCGTYVDLGSHHPVYFSNTHHFYLRGWQGLNVDARPGTKRLFDVLRPRDVNVEACVGPRDGASVEFFEFDKAALNTTDPTMARRAQEGGARLVSQRSVRTVTLANLVARYLPRARIDLLNIDIEGLDEQVLMSNDWTKLRPRVVVFERHGLDPLAVGSDPLMLRLFSHGYAVKGMTGPSWILALDEAPHGA
jgi:FkbM family methyltransferase